MANITVGAVRCNAQTDTENKILSGGSANTLTGGATTRTYFARFRVNAKNSGDVVLHFDDGSGTAAAPVRINIRGGGDDVQWEVEDGSGSVRSADSINGVNARLGDHFAVCAVIDTTAGTLAAYECGTAVSSGANQTNSNFDTSALPDLDGTFNFADVDSGDMDIDIAELAIFDGALSASEMDELYNGDSSSGVVKGVTAENISGSPPDLVCHYLITKTEGGPADADASMGQRVDESTSTIAFADLDATGSSGTLIYTPFDILDSTYASEDVSYDGVYGDDAALAGPDQVATLPSSATAIDTSTDVVTTQADHNLAVGDYIKFRKIAALVDDSSAAQPTPPTTEESNGDTIPFTDMCFRVASVPSATSLTLKTAGGGGQGGGTSVDFIDTGTFDAGDYVIDRAGNDGASARDGTHNEEGRVIEFSYGVPNSVAENADTSKRPTVTCTSLSFTSGGVATTVTRTFRVQFLSATDNGDGTSQIKGALIPNPSAPIDGNTIYRKDTSIQISIPADWLTGSTNSLAGSGSVTNGSKIEYPKPICTIITPTRPFQAYTSGFLNLDIDADHIMGIARVESTLTDSMGTNNTVAHTLTTGIVTGSNGYGPNTEGHIAWRGRHQVSLYETGVVNYPFKVYPRIGDDEAIYDSQYELTHPTVVDTRAYFDPGNTESDDVLSCYVDSRSQVTLDGSGTGTLIQNAYIYNEDKNFFGMVADSTNLATNATTLKFNYLHNPRLLGGSR